MGKGSLLYEVWLYLRVRKKWWLLPIVLLVLLLSVLIVLTRSGSQAPFLYPLF